MSDKISAVIKFPVGRCGYPKLNPASPPLQGTGANKKKRWSITQYYDPNQPAVQKLLKTLESAASEFETLHGYEASRVPQLKKVGIFTSKKKDRKNDPALVGLLSIDVGANAEKRDGGMHIAPAIFGADTSPVNWDAIYPGCYTQIVAALNEYQIEDNGLSLHGLSLTLKVVQFVRGGERMGGDNTDYTAYLENHADSEDEDDSPIVAPRRKSAIISDDDI